MFEVTNAKPPVITCSASNYGKSKDNSLIVELDIYHHWFAIRLYDLYESLTTLTTEKVTFKLLDMDISIEDQRLNKFIEILAELQEDEDNEFALSSKFCRGLDRLLFPTNTPSEGCFGQYPTKGTNRCDYAVRVNKLFKLVGDYKRNTIEFSIAQKESMGYCMNVTEETNSFNSFLGLPCTPHKLGLHLYMPGNKKLSYIRVKEVNSTDTPAVRRFLCCLIGAIECLKTHNISNGAYPACPMPKRRLELRDPLNEQCRTFYLDEKVYKLFDRQSGLSSNFDLLKNLPEYKNGLDEIKLSEDGNLCYDFKPGKSEPRKVNEFCSIIKTLHAIHDLGYVHGDVRLQNLVFGPSKSWIIDFDNALEVGTKYPECYNIQADERHPDIQQQPVQIECAFVHDWYSLAYIIGILFPKCQHIKAAVENITSENVEQVLSLLL